MGKRLVGRRGPFDLWRGHDETVTVVRWVLQNSEHRTATKPKQRQISHPKDSQRNLAVKRGSPHWSLVSSWLVSNMRTYPGQRWTHPEPILVSTNKFADFIPVLEDDKRRHLESRRYHDLDLGLPHCERVTYSTDADLLGDIWLVVHIDLIELNHVVFFREGLEDRGDESARATPRSPEVNGNDFATVDLTAPIHSPSECWRSIAVGSAHVQWSGTH